MRQAATTLPQGRQQALASDQARESGLVGRAREARREFDHLPGPASFRQDELYIDLLEAASVESREVSDGIVLDYDAAGNLVGIDIENARTKVDVDRLVLSHIDAIVETVGG